MEDDSASRRKDAWRPEQDQAIIALRAELKGWSYIAKQVGRTVESCCGRYRVLVPKERRVRVPRSLRWLPEEAAALEAMIAEKIPPKQIIAAFEDKPRKVVYAKIEYLSRAAKRVHQQRIPRVFVPAAREADRIRRMSAEMDLTAEFFGDPRPGQSALDKKQRAFA